MQIKVVPVLVSLTAMIRLKNLNWRLTLKQTIRQTNTQYVRYITAACVYSLAKFSVPFSSRLLDFNIDLLV